MAEAQTPGNLGGNTSGSIKHSWGCELKLSNSSGLFWTVTKVLTATDVGHASRLLIEKFKVEDTVLKYLSGDARRQAQTEMGTEVDVFDSEKNVTYKLILKRYVKSSGSYVLCKNWRSCFVERRGLKEGDEIGLHWEGNHFVFAVLQRASP